MVDLKITAKKVLVQIVVVLAAGLAAVYGDSNIYLALVPGINGVLNVVKHWDE